MRGWEHLGTTSLTTCEESPHTWRAGPQREAGDLRSRGSTAVKNSQLPASLNLFIGWEM